LPSITIPASVTSIGTMAFADCHALSSVLFAAGSRLQSIGFAAFVSCVSLTSIVLPHGLSVLANHVFAHNTSLSSIVIPSSVVHIGDWVFHDTPNLTIRAVGRASAPVGWQPNWNPQNRPVSWNWVG